MYVAKYQTQLLHSYIVLSFIFAGVKSKCLVRDPSGVTSPPQHGDAGFQLSINEQPEFYEERNLYTITLKVLCFNYKRLFSNLELYKFEKKHEI